MASQQPSPQPSGDVERQKIPGRKETPAATSVPPEVEESGQDAIDAQLEENDIQQFREQLRTELNLRFPKVSKKEKEQYLDKVEIELRDAFEKVCSGRGCWHRIQGVMPSIFGITQHVMVHTSYTIRNKKGKKITTDHWIQLTGFHPKTQGEPGRNESAQEPNTIEQEDLNPQTIIRRVLGEISFPNLYGSLAELARMSENFPAHDVRRYLQEMERIAAELARAGDDPERLRGIAEEGQNRLKEMAGSLDEEIPAALMRDRGISIEEFHAEAENPNTPLGALSQAQKFNELVYGLTKPTPPPPTSFPDLFEEMGETIKRLQDLSE